MGALLATFLNQVTRDSHSYQPADGPRLSTVLADLNASVFASALDADRSLPPETHRRALTLHIMAFIRSNADDPQLDIPAIAAAHHISDSYLHRLFQREGDRATVTGFLQQQRLSRVRGDLTDPRHQDVPVYLLAARRGFSHASAFRRPSETPMACPPAAFRRKTLGAPCAADAGAGPRSS